MYRLLPLALALVACKPDPTKDGEDTQNPVTDAADDTGGSDTDTGPCTATVLLNDDGTAAITPENGATGVYYRDPIVVSFEGDASSAIITLTDSAGGTVSATPAWSDGNVQATLSPVLAADTMYTLSVNVCGVDTVSTFSTSSLGAPLTIADADLVGRTYSWRLSESTITEPAFLDFVASSYLTMPLLVGVTAADESSIDLLGGVGNHENDGSYTQVMSEDTWDFPAGDFAEHPYFEAYADSIVITYESVDIPIEQFHLSGTFTADGTAIERGVGSGLADSRHMGPLVNQTADDYSAICDIAAGAGVTCQPCGDGQPYCIYVVAEDITATYQPGLTLTPVP